MDEAVNIVLGLAELAEKYGPALYEAIRELIIANKDPSGLTKEVINNFFKEQVSPAFNQLNRDCTDE